MHRYIYIYIYEYVYICIYIIHIYIRGTSLMRKSPPPEDPPRVLGIILL